METGVRVGWASRDITPVRPVSLRGLFNLRIATRVNDPLTLTAMAIEAGGEHAIFVSVDACAVDASVLKRVQKTLAERLPEVDPAKIIAGATHTHTAPFAGCGVGLQKDTDYLDNILAKYPDYMTTAEYTDLGVEALTSAVCDAWKARSDGFIGWGYSYAVVGENRRVRYFDDRAVMYGSTAEDGFSHIEGHVDHTVNLLFAYDSSRNLTGVLVNVACPSQCSEGGQDFVSADYWHEVRNELRERYGPNLFILPQCSAAGDQSPHRQIGSRAEARMLQLKYGEGLSRSRNVALRSDIARRIADAVDDAEPWVRDDLHADLNMEHVCRSLDLPHWDVTEREYEEMKAQITELDKTIAGLKEGDPLGASLTSAQSRRNWCARVISRYESPLDSVPISVNIVRLGDVAFVTSPFEYYLDFGDRIKGRSPALQTFVAQLAGSGTYLATERAAAGCSYGAVPASCKVSPAGGQIIVDGAIDELNRMF